MSRCRSSGRNAPRSFASSSRNAACRCTWSVENYGVVPDDATDSIVVLQHELAIERAAAGDFCRLIWMPPDLEAADERQRKFIEQLETDSRLQAGADILKTALEDFKSVLHVRLTQSAAPKPERSESAASSGARCDAST